MQLYYECKSRGFDVECYNDAWGYDLLKGNYEPTEEAIKISQERINEKIAAKPGFYRYYGKPVQITVL